MTTLAQVRLWGSTIGAVALDERSSTANFEYEEDFASSGIQLAPLMMPLPGSHKKVFRFPALAQQTFHGLPGLLADALPDRFGHALIDAWLASQGRAPDTFNAVERLCYVGQRAMGALEFAPVTGPRAKASQRVDISQLVGLASRVLTQRQSFATHLSQDDPDGLRDILRVGTSAGGARAKAVIAWHPESGDVRSGQLDADAGYQHWLLKFDGVSANRDKELADPQGYGQIEYAYYLMARDAGITMSECRLLEEGDRHHFMTRRFDRTDAGDKLHMQSLCAMAHFDYNAAGAYSYEQALQVMQQLNLSHAEVEQQFRRMVFNIVARNQDDHTKNIAFLMDRAGQWSLSPAFDLTFSYNPDGDWTSSHQMSLNGRRDHFTLDDFKACARLATLKRGRAEAIIEDVSAVVRRWPEYADRATVAARWRDRIQPLLRVDIL
ncbi:type II toxin-antitoxin system HipA family toxin [Pseudohongiella sp.]|uniref:HipA-like C-terminal domain-containing protein n=1 Tax=marine sediment metagenome TaxID=412755 RepID=A0A0F9Y9Y2_9ZZZZ|nr:type II toxin-antitoxin system HipA family toxin [Pseudohongiella sp.]HDZ08754.1 type II toxin-antitoxin system HipA family toxin [Pseudohongiella sp.]HEA62370.1 type II toxin-antitoxin system HipA family toxin [Pseudohongiella sp.]